MVPVSVYEIESINSELGLLSGTMNFRKLIFVCLIVVVLISSGETRPVPGERWDKFVSKAWLFI